MKDTSPYKDLAGYVASRQNEINGGWIVIYRARIQQMDVGEKYAVSCETHNTLVGVASIPKARPLLKVPDFCEKCMSQQKQGSV